MTRSLRVAAALSSLALIAAIVPMPPGLVERWYSTGLYPQVQRVLTSASNRVPIALLDMLLVVVATLLAVNVVRGLRADGWKHTATRTVVALVSVGATVYLLFLALWGLNYRRIPLEEKLAFEPSRITSDTAVAFATRAVQAMNSGYTRAHQATFDPGTLAASFASAERALGSTHVTVIGAPKRSALAWYFRRAAIDGMTDPFFLEIILNPDVLPFERPFVQAHEWAHLAGFADESEANFVAFLTCVRGDAIAQYSGWLAAYEHVVPGIPRRDRRTLPRVAPGPLSDLQAIAERYERSSIPIRRAARSVYDQYLRANRVEEGIASYDAVVRLMLGCSFDAAGNPLRR